MSITHEFQRATKPGSEESLPSMLGCGVSWAFPWGIPAPAAGAEPGWDSLPPSPSTLRLLCSAAAHRCQDPVFRPGGTLGSTGYFRGVCNR